MENEKAKRIPVDYRLDILVPSFIEAMGKVGAKGAKLYGEHNWKKSRLTGGDGPVNHMFKHLLDYIGEKEHKHFTDYHMHLASIAFNAMMEWWYSLEMRGGYYDQPDHDRD